MIEDEWNITKSCKKEVARIILWFVAVIFCHARQCEEETENVYTLFTLRNNCMCLEVACVMYNVNSQQCKLDESLHKMLEYLSCL